MSHATLSRCVKHCLILGTPQCGIGSVAFIDALPPLPYHMAPTKGTKTSSLYLDLLHHGPWPDQQGVLHLAFHFHSFHPPGPLEAALHFSQCAGKNRRLCHK